MNNDPPQLEEWWCRQRTATTPSPLLTKAGDHFLNVW